MGLRKIYCLALYKQFEEARNVYGSLRKFLREHIKEDSIIPLIKLSEIEKKITENIPFEELKPKIDEISYYITL